MPQVVAGAVALTGAAFALPTGFSVVGALGATGWIGAVAQFGAGLILSGVSQQLFGPDVSGLELKGRNVTVREPVVPRDIVWGATRKGGVVAFLHVTGDANQYLHLVVMLAGHECQSIGAVYFNGEEAVAADGVTVADRYIENSSPLITVDKRLGTVDQTAFAGLIADAPDKWTSDHRLREIACVYLRLEWNADAFATGIPEMSFDIEGRNQVYDPRSQLFGYTTNAALCAADYLADTRYGLGAPYGTSGGIIEADLIEAANVCDEAVALDAGGSEARYTCNGVVGSGETPKSIIEGLLSASAGRAAVQGASWRLRAGAYRAPTVNLTEDDWRGGEMRLSTLRQASQNFNGVRAQFVSPLNDYQPDDAPVYQSAAYLAEDQGVERFSDITLRFTDSPTMAQRIMKIHLERARRQQSVNFPGKLAAFRAAAGNTLTFDRPRFGFSAKPFEVHGVTLTRQGNMAVPDLVLRETSPLIYDWAASEEQIYQAAPRTTLPSASDLDLPGAPQITEDLFETRSDVRALLRVEWSPAASAFVSEYQLQARRVEDPDGSPTGDDWLTVARPTEPRAEILDVSPGLWEVRVRAKNSIGIASAYVETSQQISGLLAPPAQLTGFNVQQFGGTAVLTWDQSVDLDVRAGGKIVIRHSESSTPNWANSVSYRTVDGAIAVAAVPLKPGTYLIRAIDSTGNPGPVSSKATKGAQVIAFTNADALIESPVWSGAKTNVEIDGSSMKLTDNTQSGTYEFSAAIDLGVVKTARVRSSIDVAALNLAANIDDRLANMDDWADFDDTEGAEIDVIVEWRVTDGDPAGSPVWSGWERLDSTEEEFRGAEFRAILSSASPDFNVLLSGLSVTADEVL